MFFSVITAHILFASGNDTTLITIVASGETHGMLYPCDCPSDPGGGLAERASALRTLRGKSQDALLLLDAGGFAGGGIYDDFTGGRAADSARTAAAVRAMGLMKYDAVAVGDDDLQYGAAWLARAAGAEGLPLLSANLKLTNNKKPFPAFRIVVRNGVRFAVAAVTSPERLFPADDSCRILPPVPAVRKTWKEMAAASDFRVVLSHLGEEESYALADSFPDCDVIVNGHRKISRSPVTVRGKTVIMQFGYEGKKLSWAAVRCSKKTRTVIVEKSGWIDIGPADGADTAVAKTLAEQGAEERRGVYDLYIMSRCPYGREALRELCDFTGRFPDVEWNVWFIGTAVPGPGDSLTSLHGAEEIYDEMSMLAVKSLYPGRWRFFLDECAKPGAATEPVIAAMGLDRKAIAAWVSASGRDALAGHYRRSMRLGITASPSLFVNNTAFEKPVESRRLAKAECLFRREKPETRSFCDSLPECFDDNECVKKGMVGRCLPAGKCAFQPDAPFSFVALVGDSTVRHPEAAVLATTGELFPNASITTVPCGSAKGSAMMKAYSPVALPFYLFGTGAAGAHNFYRVESGLEKVAGGFTFKRGVTPKNYFPRRPRTAGGAALFVDPLFPDALKAVGALSADTALSGKVRVLPVIYGDPRESAADVGEKVRREEALRWLVMDSLHRRAFPQYLADFIRDPGSSYWFINLSASGVAQDIFIKEVRARPERLQEHWRLLDTLGIKEPVVLLVENRQTVVIRNEEELADMFGLMKKRAGKR
ncbi:MAG: hypothetical protein JW699_08090 [Chitinispirillaceae bacterium]|nr:hypothetical protein [Chitinispirillaceae bacterium]